MKIYIIEGDLFIFSRAICSDFHKRNNEYDPVPPSERVYPQHLIGVALDFLEAAGVDWGEVRNTEELRKQLNL